MKILSILLFVLSTFAFGDLCSNSLPSSPRLRLTHYGPPTESGTYYDSDSDGIFSNGDSIEIGKGYMYSNWNNNFFYKTHDISCIISDILPRRKYDEVGRYTYCYMLTIDCSVSEKTQFYEDDVKYTDTEGYRKNGTLKWTREHTGSTDFYCYDKNGMKQIKRVNNPKYCN